MSSLSIVTTMIALGLFAGVLSGMFGIGGGLVIVPFLALVVGLDQKTATGTSLFALMWPVGLLGVLEYWRRGEMDLRAGIWIAAGLFMGAYFGARITGLLSAATMKRAYAVFLLVVGVYYLATTKDAPKPRPAPPPVPAPAPSGGEPPSSL